MMRRLPAMNWRVVMHGLDAPRAVIAFVVVLGADVSSVDGEALYRLAWPLPIRPPLSQLFHRAQLVAQQLLDGRSQRLAFHLVRLGPQVALPACWLRDQTCLADPANYNPVVRIIGKVIKTYN